MNLLGITLPQARRDIKRFMNVGFSDESPDPSKALYYGQPPSRIKQYKVAFGQSALGSYWRMLKEKILVKA